MRIETNRKSGFFGRCMMALAPLGAGVDHLSIPLLKPSQYLSFVSYLDHWQAVSWAIAGAFGLFTAAALAFYLVRFIKKSDAPQKGGPFLPKVLSRLLALLLLLAVLLWIQDLYRVYLFRYGFSILLLWFGFAALTLWLTGRFEKWGLIAALGLHHCFALYLLFNFMHDHPTYSVDFVILILAAVMLNAALIFRKKIGRLIALNVGLVTMVVLAGSVAGSMILKNPAARIAANPPKFGAVTLVPGTKGKAIRDLAFSPKSRTLFFISEDQTKGLGKLSLPSSTPEYLAEGLDRFSSLARNKNGTILYVGGSSDGEAAIQAYRMDHFDRLGQYEMPGGALAPASVDLLDVTETKLYGGVHSASGTFFNVCAALSDDASTQREFGGRCFHLSLEAKRINFLTGSDFVNRILIGTGDTEIGISNGLVEYLGEVFTLRRTRNVPSGVLTLQYAEKAYNFFAGHPFTSGFDYGEADHFQIISSLPGPLSVSKIFARNSLMAAGSYIDGQIIIFNKAYNVHKMVYVGPGITGIDFDPDRSLLFIGTRIGIMQVQLDLLFDNVMAW